MPAWFPTVQTMINCQSSLSLIAPAKLNLSLRVLGRRPDGYHLLQSLFWPIGLADTLEINARERFELRCEWAADAPYPQSQLPAVEENLVARAHRACAKIQREIVLRKRIPIGSGMGGGSSDAGTYLRFLIENHEISELDARRIAIELGADVPFFLDPRPSWVTGIGEEIRPLFLTAAAASIGFLLVFPSSGTSTGRVFQNYRLSGKPFTAPSPFDAAAPLDIRDLIETLRQSGNDLEEVVSQELPQIADILGNLRRLPCWYAGLSGTGSTCFAVFPTLSEASESAKGLSSFFRMYNCRSVTVATHWVS